MKDPITTSIKILTDYFHKNNIQYVIVGGIAVLVFGRTRMTTDIDMIIDHKAIDRVDFINYLRDNNFDANLSDLKVLDEGVHASIFYKDDMFRIDLKGIYGENEQRSIDSAIEIPFNQVLAKFDHPLNIIGFKLLYGSEQDFEDALAVFIRNQEFIDMNKLEELCNSLGVLPQLEELLNEINNEEN